MVMCSSCGQYNDVSRGVVPLPQHLPSREPAKPWWNTPLAVIVPLLVFGVILWVAGSLWMVLVLITAAAVWGYFSDFFE